MNNKFDKTKIYAVKVQSFEEAMLVQDLFEKLGYEKSTFDGLRYLRYPRYIIAGLTYEKPLTTGIDTIGYEKDIVTLTINQLKDLIDYNKNEFNLNSTQAFIELSKNNVLEYMDEFNEICPVANGTSLYVFFSNDYKFRLKPRTIKIGDVEINAPEIEPLKYDQNYFVPSFINKELCVTYTWRNNFTDKENLNRSLVHVIKENAVSHTKALILASGGKV